jgi:hypothetical protein
MQPTKTVLLNEYLAIVDSIHGAYLDAITGFFALVEEYDAEKTRMMASHPDIPSEAFDTASFMYGTGRPHRPTSTLVHACTQGEYRQRNEEGGQNHIVMGQLCVVQMFGFWEDCYREKIAKCCGKNKDGLLVDVMGDLRLFRNSIVHNGGNAKKDVERCKLLRWFHQGDAMIFTPQHFEEVVSRVRRDLSAYVATI